MRRSKFKIVKVNANLFQTLVEALTKADGDVFGAGTKLENNVLVVIPFGSKNAKLLNLGPEDFGGFFGTAVIARTK